MQRFAARPVATRVRREGRWVELSYRELAEQVQAASLGLRELGLADGDRVAILSENRPEWAITDFACLAARCTDVPIYPTLPARQVDYILRDSGAVAVLVSSVAQLEKILAIRAQLPALRHVIAFDADARAPGVLPFDDLVAAGARRRGATPLADPRAFGLAGRPRDAHLYLGHDGRSQGRDADARQHRIERDHLRVAVPLRQGDECLSFLPLSHIFERMFGHYSMFYAGVTINYAGSIDTVAADMQDRRPTMMASVPRLYEKIYSRVLDSVRAGSASQRRIFEWARRVGEEWVDRRLAGAPIPPRLALQRLVADRLVFAKLRARTGGRIRFFISGGAPLSAEIAKFFCAAGMPILEGYGLTETSPVMAVNTFGHTKLGTVGRPIPDVEIRIAEDGEIVTRGPNVMCGYYGKPQATGEAVDAQGWFHTGDIGVIDAEGYLRITDRKKDLIVTAGGKNIAPQPIENLAKRSKYVSNAVMLGDRRPFPIMLIVPNAEPLQAWAARHGLPADDVARLVAMPDVHTKVEREVRKTLRDLAQFEMPKKFLLLPRDFSVEGGELTPTLKVRRRIVEERHKAAIEALYAEPHAG